MSEGGCEGRRIIEGVKDVERAGERERGQGTPGSRYLRCIATGSPMRVAPGQMIEGEVSCRRREKGVVECDGLNLRFDALFRLCFLIGTSILFEISNS